VFGLGGAGLLVALRKVSRGDKTTMPGRTEYGEAPTTVEITMYG